MLHTGDRYEIRARAERHRELQALSRIVAGFLFRSRSTKTAMEDLQEAANSNAGEPDRTTDRAA